MMVGFFAFVADRFAWLVREPVRLAGTRIMSIQQSIDRCPEKSGKPYIRRIAFKPSDLW